MQTPDFDCCEHCIEHKKDYLEPAFEGPMTILRCENCNIPLVLGPKNTRLEQMLRYEQPTFCQTCGGKYLVE